jgi:hypothetical protein
MQALMPQISEPDKQENRIVGQVKKRDAPFPHRKRSAE